MAYQIDFTASNYVLRSRRKITLRLLLAGAIAAVAGVVHDCYVTYNKPTLNMRLADYEAAAHPIEEMSAKWDEAAKDYNSMVRYYRLVWAANATNFLSVMASDRAPRPERGLCPTSWQLSTGGDCVLTYRYAFGIGDPAEQVRGLEDRIVNLVTSAVEVVGGRVDVQGVRHENLLNVPGFNVAARFSLPNARTFPVKESTLAGCVAEITDFRKKVQEAKIKDKSASKSAQTTAQTIMMKYLDPRFEKDKKTGLPLSDFPKWRNAIDVGGWLGRADQFILKNGIPDVDGSRRPLKETWNQIGEARLPWSFGFWNARYRALDNEELVVATKALVSVSDGVKRFKPFLEKRRADCQKKLKPFVGAYLRDDVFNNPFIARDLTELVAKNAGVARASVPMPVPGDEIVSDASVLIEKDERFTFTWVKWKLLLGGVTDRGEDGHRSREESVAADPLTLQMVADCARRALSLGPGYALDKVRIDFGPEGKVSGAVLEGLLPVKKVESLKKDAKDGH